ncbi:hypothetical protein F4861DRAFT_510490 [Xylaria intraflava]|nr:hypothetical protein F4861DRAFT_510490 [Xylaria intraflava]
MGLLLALYLSTGGMAGFVDFVMACFFCLLGGNVYYIRGFLSNALSVYVWIMGRLRSTSSLVGYGFYVYTHK